MKTHLHQSRTIACYLCNRFYRVYSGEILTANLDGTERWVCKWCFLAYVFYNTVKDMLVNGSKKDVEQAVRVLEGINDLVEENPHAQAIRYVIDRWAHEYPKVVSLDELASEWRFATNMDKVIEYLESEGILPSRASETAAPSFDLMSRLLQMLPSQKEFYTRIVKAVTGLAVARYLTDPHNRRLRMIYATLQAISAHLSEGDREPVHEIKGYSCKICGKTFSSFTEAKSHVQHEHDFEVEDEESAIEEILGRKLGEWVRLSFFCEKASLYGVSDFYKYLRYMLTKGALIPQEEDFMIKRRGGEEYIAVDEAWIRVRERMRILERQLIRSR
ncbi:MAG: hypothetical protein QW096_11920 [Thermofilaceae archaeon]